MLDYDDIAERLDGAIARIEELAAEIGGGDPHSALETLGQIIDVAARGRAYARRLIRIEGEDA